MAVLNWFVKRLKQNFNLDTKYYAKVDFQSFEKIVDSMFPKGVKNRCRKITEFRWC
jgi:anionic cell wall polymer biosynthesis LytR-Cps2A-Psr (LCP) family protein